MLKRCKELRLLQRIKNRLAGGWVQGLVAYSDVRGAERELAEHYQAAIHGAGVIDDAG